VSEKIRRQIEKTTKIILGRAKRKVRKHGWNDEGMYVK
jgi:hypothetical protein